MKSLIIGLSLFVLSDLSRSFGDDIIRHDYDATVSLVGLAKKFDLRKLKPGSKHVVSILLRNATGNDYRISSPRITSEVGKITRWEASASSVSPGGSEVLEFDLEVYIEHAKSKGKVVFDFSPKEDSKKQVLIFECELMNVVRFENRVFSYVSCDDGNDVAFRVPLSLSTDVKPGGLRVLPGIGLEDIKFCIVEENGKFFAKGEFPRARDLPPSVSGKIKLVDVSSLKSDEIPISITLRSFVSVFPDVLAFTKQSDGQLVAHAIVQLAKDNHEGEANQVKSIEAVMPDLNVRLESKIERVASRVYRVQFIAPEQSYPQECSLIADVFTSEGPLQVAKTADFSARRSLPPRQ